MMALKQLLVAVATVAVLLIVAGTQRAEAKSAQPDAPPTPVFADNYHVHGVLSLPYAELNEPFNAYFDKQADRSRADYYGGEYKVYQFGPKSAPEAAGATPYGSIYKLLYVPKSFKTPGEQVEGVGERVSEALKHAAERLLHQHRAPSDSGNGGGNDDDDDDDDDDDAMNDEHIRTSRTPIKRACFGVKGGVGSTVRAQTVLPDLHDFTYDSTGRCPYVAGGEHRAAKCELWKFSNEVGAKKNSYKFWLRREKRDQSGDSNGTEVVVPVHYYMLGYDSLLGSHYDRYDITYWNYRPGGARDEHFAFDVKGNKCAGMPGPGDPATEAQVRAHLVAQNPIHQFVEAPHRYDHIDHHYAEFKAKFGGGRAKSEQVGWFNFLHNLRFIHGKNRELKEYKLAVNKFADENLAAGDLRYLRGRRHSKGYNGGLDYAQKHRELREGAAVAASLPDHFDWTVLGAVTPVKDQAVCGSCWSFGTAGTIEGNYFAKTGKLLRLSQQQLVDCSWQYGNNGCDGGEDFRAYAYIKAAGGLSTEEDYGHYKGIDGRCHDQDVEKPVKISGFYNVTVNSVEALQHAIVNYGPVSISIDASRPTFTFYSHGAYYDDKCQNSPDSLDHSVLAVGFTKINGKLVWKVKNSWSTYWGNDGYIYMLAENNNCGVLDAPTVPIIAN